MTGQSGFAFASVVIKELMDNAFDACETARVAPEVFLDSSRSPEEIQITVSDNAGAIPPDTVRGALDFNVLDSDKAAYRSPTRGAQGNALKTVFGIPYALGSVELVVEAKGLRQEVRVCLSPGGLYRMHHTLPSGKTYHSNAPFFTNANGLVFRRWFEHERLLRRA
jgi:hypothetical protein